MGDFARDYAYGQDARPTPLAQPPATFQGIVRADGRVAEILPDACQTGAGVALDRGLQLDVRAPVARHALDVRLLARQRVHYRVDRRAEERVERRVRHVDRRAVDDVAGAAPLHDSGADLAEAGHAQATPE